MKNIIIASIHDNRGRLNNELNFIKNYFFKDNINFNINKIKRAILQELNDLDNKDEELIDIQEENEEEDNKYDYEFIKKMSSNKQVLVEKDKLIRNIYQLGNKYIVFSKINRIEDHDSNEKEDLINKFIKFFNTLFETNFSFAKLENEEEFNKIINFTKKIYLNNLEIDLIRNKSENKNTLVLISEFFDILEVFEHKNKRVMLLLLQKIKEYNDIFNDDNTKLDFPTKINNINNLFYFIKSNVKENESILLIIKLLIKEANKIEDKNFHQELLNLIIPKEAKVSSYNFLFRDLAPIIDHMLGEEFTQLLDFSKRYGKDYDIFDRSNFANCFKILSYGVKTNVIFEEMVLFYFESKIMNIFENAYKDEDFLNINNGCYNLLEYFLNKLDVFEINREKDKNCLLILFSIAYIKCYYYKLINYIYEGLEVKNNILDELYIGIGSITFKKTIMIFALKLIFRYIGNLDEFDLGDKYYKNYMNKFIKLFDEFKNLENVGVEFIENNIDSGFDFIIIPNKNKEIFLEVFNAVLEIKRDYKTSNKDNLINIINKVNDIDIIYCVLLNLIFSFYYQKYVRENNATLINGWKK